MRPPPPARQRSVLEQHTVKSNHPPAIQFSICKRRVHLHIQNLTIHLSKSEFLTLVQASNGCLHMMVQEELLEPDMDDVLGAMSEAAHFN